MKDTEIRALVLKYFYEKRYDGYDGYQQWTDDDILNLGHGLNKKIVFGICDQLSDHNLIVWKPVKNSGVGTVAGMGKITAHGVDVVEGNAMPDIKVEFVQNKTVSITGSSNVVVGNNNIQNITQHIHQIEHAINSSTGSDEEKTEAKSLLRKFIEHPLVTSIAGGTISLLG